MTFPDPQTVESEECPECGEGELHWHASKWGTRREDAVCSVCGYGREDDD